MNDLLVQDFKEYVVVVREHPAGIGGFQMVLRFPNNYGASVIQAPFSCGGDLGLYEIGVIYFNDNDNESWSLTHSTPVTTDVLGRLTVEDCFDTFRKIMALPAVVPEPAHPHGGNLGELLQSFVTIMSATTEQ